METMTEQIMIRVSKEDKDQFETEAAALGLSVAAFLRMLVKQWVAYGQIRRITPQEIPAD
jgi:antitoxin component of RelBE/YafQ-DinJ toxin-antitoxin module